MEVDKKIEVNIQAQIKAISKASLLELSERNRGLVNVFTKDMAEGLKHDHLLGFRQIGEKEFHLRISCYILKTPSTAAPNRRRALQTFASKKSTQRRVSQLEKDQKLVLATIKKKMLFSLKTGTKVDRPHEQLVQYPMSLMATPSQGKSPTLQSMQKL